MCIKTVTCPKAGFGFTAIRSGQNAPPSVVRRPSAFYLQPHITGGLPAYRRSSLTLYFHFYIFTFIFSLLYFHFYIFTFIFSLSYFYFYIFTFIFSLLYFHFYIFLLYYHFYSFRHNLFLTIRKFLSRAYI
jgi:hypothetical protein